MTEKLKDFLAVENGLTEERYIEKIRKGVEVEYPNKADEIAHLRKEIDYLRSIIIDYILPANNIQLELTDTEYTKYTIDVEEIKNDAKKSLNIVE